MAEKINVKASDEITEAESAEVVEDAKAEAIDYERMVTVIVPRDESQRKAKFIRLTLNGKYIDIPRGVAVEVPYKYKLLLEKKVQLRQMDEEYKEELEAALRAEP